MRSITPIASIARVACQRLRTAALAAVLACAANGAHASFASVVINDFSVSGTLGPDAAFFFAPTDVQLQSWFLQAVQAGGGTVTNNNSALNWNNQTQTAQTANAKATVSSTKQTDPLTALETPLFTLGATATSSLAGLLNTAVGNFFTSGGFCFGDGSVFDGTSLGCNASGSLTFSVNYDLIAELSGSPRGSSASADLSMSGTGLPGFLFDSASTFAGGSKTGLTFTWTQDLSAGDISFFALQGNAVAQAVPEPGILSLAALGLIGLAATRRRSARSVS